jgi:hypothetical protein
MCLKSLGIIILNFDELQEDAKAWTELFDPDIAHLFGNEALPNQIWRFNEFAKREVMESCGVIDRVEDENTKISIFSGLNFKLFQFLLWSKFKLSEDLPDDRLLREFRKRFERSLPLNSINMVFIQSLQDE